MPSCERCWHDSAMARYTGDTEEYARLLAERDKTGGCTPEQQAGPDARECPNCHRMTLHQLCGICMNGCAATPAGL